MLLLAANVDPDAVGIDGLTPLEVHAACGFFHTLMLLVKAGASVPEDSRNKNEVGAIRKRYRDAIRLFDQ